MESHSFKLPGDMTLNDLYYMMDGAALAIESPERIADGLRQMPMTLRLMAQSIMRENGQPVPTSQS